MIIFQHKYQYQVTVAVVHLKNIGILQIDSIQPAGIWRKVFLQYRTHTKKKNK